MIKKKALRTFFPCYFRCVFNQSAPLERTQVNVIAYNLILQSIFQISTHVECSFTIMLSKNGCYKGAYYRKTSVLVGFYKKFGNFSN